MTKPLDDGHMTDSRNRPAILIPIQHDGMPDLAGRQFGQLMDASKNFIRLEMDQPLRSSELPLMLGVLNEDGTLQYDGVRVMSEDGQSVVCNRGGLGQALLTLLQGWTRLGVLNMQPLLTDAVANADLLTKVSGPHVDSAVPLGNADPSVPLTLLKRMTILPFPRHP